MIPSMATHPWMKFYPTDWRADPRLRVCSLAARGLWIDMITYMHEGKPYGHLTINESMPSVEDIAALVGRPLAEVKKALIELEEKQVFARTEGGTIFSRRMIRDKAKAERAVVNGKHGGNPKLKMKDKKQVNLEDKGKDKPQKLEARIDDEDEARADYLKKYGDKPLISDDAYKLCDKLMEIQRLEKDDPRCIAAAYTCQAWLTKGWKAEIIQATVDIVMSRRPDAPSALRYYEKAIALAHADAERPLPVATPMERKNHVGIQANGNLLAVADQYLAAFRGSRVCDGEDAPPLRAIPKGGGE
jgi:hypothetical protein